MRYLYALLALGLLLAVHELGHLLMARLLGLRVERFSLGFGPPLLAFRVGRTRVTLGALPLGGAVEIHGMNPHAERLDPEDASSFVAQPRWRRALVHLAGPLSNYLVALAVLAALYVSGTHVPVPLAIGTVVPASEAARAQLVPGDVIRDVNGARVKRWSEFAEAVAARPGVALRLGVERGGVRREVLLTPRADEQGEGRVGVTQQYVYRSHGLGEALGLAVLHTGRVAMEGLSLVAELAKGEPGRELAAGPSALVRQASEATTSGLDTFLRLGVAISLALCLFYLLPLPSLDGGRVLLLALEALTGRALDRRVQTLLQTLGFLLLVAAVLYVATAELRRGLRHFQATAPARGAPPDAGSPSVLPPTDGGLPSDGAAPRGR